MNLQGNKSWHHEMVNHEIVIHSYSSYILVINAPKDREVHDVINSHDVRSPIMGWMTMLRWHMWWYIYMKYGRCHVVYPHFSTLNDDTSIYPQFCWDIMGIRQLSIYPILSHPIPSNPILSIYPSIDMDMYILYNQQYVMGVSEYFGYRVFSTTALRAKNMINEKVDFGIPNMFRQSPFYHPFHTGFRRFCNKWVWVTSQFPLSKPLV